MTALKVTLQNIVMIDHCRMHQVNELSAQAEEQHKVLFSDSIQRWRDQRSAHPWIAKWRVEVLHLHHGLEQINPEIVQFLTG